MSNLVADSPTVQGLRLVIEDDWATIQIARPEKKNAMSPALHDAMHQALDRIVARDTVKVVVLTGVDDVFCGGMDLEKYFLEAFDDPEHFRQNLRTSHGWMRRWKELPAVTLASVNGWCIGGGLLIASLCDIVLAAKEATFSLSEVNFGIFPSGGTSWGVAHAIHSKQALYYMLTAEQFDGDTAVEIGLAHRAVPRSELDRETRRVVELLRGKNLEALRYTKRVYERVRNMSYAEAQEYEVAMLFDLSYQTGNSWIRNALTKFKERRYRPGVESYTRDDAREPPTGSKG